MAEFPPTPAPTPTPAPERVEYQPLSPWAIAGFGLGCLFAVVVLGSFLFAVYEGAPFYLPSWVAFLALAGAGVSIIAYWQVRLAEGTRAGQGLARWGIWLGLFSGLGYFAFSYFTLLALAEQARSFLLDKDQPTPQGQVDSGFFPHLIAGSKDHAEINRAFMLTLPPSHRSGNPADEKEMATLFDVTAGAQPRGQLSSFREHWLVREILFSDPDKVEVTPLGIQKWDFDKGSYHVLRHYRISLPEKIIEVSLPVQSIEPSEEGERRKWFLALNIVQDAIKQQTELGKTLQNLRGGVYKTVLEWLQDLPGKITVKDATDWARAVPLENHRGFVRNQSEQTLRGEKVGNFNLSQSSGESLPWKQLGDKLQLSYPLRLTTPKTPSIPGYLLDGLVTVESAGPVNLQSPGTPKWNIVSLEWLRSNQVNDTFPGPRK